MHPFDPRAVANLMLDLADELTLPIDHIKLQKLVYFAHGMHFVRTGQPLVAGHFEAWQYGPVHPAIYRAFREAGRHPITTRAEREDLRTGRTEKVESVTEPEVRASIFQLLNSLGRMSSRDLVDLSHVKDGPWARVVEDMRAGVAFGARIDDDVLLGSFFRHKRVVSSVAAHAEGHYGAQSVETRLDDEKPLVASYGTSKSLR
jgi:uncharacterized phage-associated protein